MVDLTVLILTKNEETTLEKCVASIGTLAKRIVVVDSYSDDRTEAVAAGLDKRLKKHGSRLDFYKHEFTDQATQFNWGLDNTDIDTEWVLRMDADEFLTKELRREINEKLDRLPENVTGIILRRRIIFMGRWIKHGGIYPTMILRLFRKNAGRCEQSVMDEHIVLDHGRAINFKNDFVNDDIKSLSWWIKKHDSYSQREVLDYIKNTGDDPEITGVKKRLFGSQAERKRWLKYKVYYRIPGRVRVLLYYLYRMYICGGFLDGIPGFYFHFFQAYWYRMLVDAKLYEYNSKNGCSQKIHKNY